MTAGSATGDRSDSVPIVLSRLLTPMLSSCAQCLDIPSTVRAACAAPPRCATSCARRMLAPSQLVLPLFVRSGTGVRQPVASMPGVQPDVGRRDAARRARGGDAGVGGVLLFGIPDHKDADGLERVGRRGPGAARRCARSSASCRSSSSSPTSACASTPITGTAACSRTARSTTTRRSSCSRARRCRTRAPAPTSSRRAT